MILTPASFTYENLSSMKFKELQKLSVQHHVNKRWAKKQELIENLLALKKSEKTSLKSSQDEENEWKDGSTVFGDATEKKDENEVDRRLTFNVNTKSNVEHSEAHLTFEISQNGKNLLGESGKSRETYNTMPSMPELGIETLKESRATFDIPLKKQLVDEVDPRATFDIPQNGKKLLKASKTKAKKTVKEGNAKELKENADACQNQINDSAFKADFENIRFDINIKDKEEPKKGGKEKTQMKTLTIPCARITRRTRKEGETSKTDHSPIKMSKKSINIKKLTKVPVYKSDIIKSPAFSSLRNSISKQTIIQNLTKYQPGEIMQSKLPVRLDFKEEKTPLKIDCRNKENMRKTTRKSISKTADEAVSKKSSSVKVNFKTPPPSTIKTSKVLPLKKTPMRREINGTFNMGTAATPGNKSTTKPITATKMPDFSKIHKRQFEQMDSLHDYLKKKEERIRKLFGTPQPGQQLQALNKSAPVFRFQSVTAEKENKGRETLKAMATPVKRRDNDSKTAQKEAFKSKLPPPKLRTDIKDKNRSHIHGVRTNKRFELQMKFRNM